MDAATRRVASEILEASLAEPITEPEVVSFTRLSEAFVSLGGAIAEIEVGNFARQLDSVQSDEGAELRQKIATDLHRKAARTIRCGMEVSSIAWRMAGREAEEAMKHSAWELRSLLNEDDVPAASMPEAMSLAHRNYVLAASDLDHARKSDNPADDFRGFAQDILGNVVVQAVAGAAMARVFE